MVVLLLSSSFRKIYCLGHPSQICHIVRDYYSHVCSCYDWNVTKITFCRVLNTPKASNLLVGQICGTVLCHFDWYGASKTC